jgi:hypothetical protein
VDDVLLAVERVGKERFRLICYIDLYGDTVFNGLMLTDVINDLDQLLSLAIGKKACEIARNLRGLAEPSRQTHRYLKFIGD